MLRTLFLRHDLHDVWKKESKPISQIITLADQDIIFESPREVLLDYYANIATIDLLSIDWDSASCDYKIFRLEPSSIYGLSGNARNQWCFVTRYLFTGNPQLLDITSGGGVIYGYNEGDQLFIVDINISGSPTPQSAEASKTRSQKMLQHHTTHINNLINHKNQELIDTIKGSIDTIKKLRNEGRNAIESTGTPIPVKRTELSFTQLPLKRKLPELVGGTGDYILTDAVYMEILDTISRFGSLAERTPSSFQSHNEETLRDFLHAILNGSYELNSAAEAFNRSGKTDILIKFRGGIGFIAECKIWRGASKVPIDLKQLFGYITWKDTKTSLIYFSRNRDPEGTLEKACNAVRAHPSFRDEIENDYKGRASFVVEHPEKNNTFVALELIVFDITEPTIPNKRIVRNMEPVTNPD